MTGTLMNHLWQSTLFAGLAAALTLAFRQNRAQVRYWLWFSASMEVPSSIRVADHAGPPSGVGTRNARNCTAFHFAHDDSSERAV
jgi:hypothetical protein